MSSESTATQNLATISFPALLFFAGDGQAEHRYHPTPGDVQTARILRVGQVERPAVLAAVDFRVAPVGFFHVTALLFQHVGSVKPALQVSAAELSLGVLFVTGALAWLLQLDLVVGKLGRLAVGLGSGLHLRARQIVPRSASIRANARIQGTFY